MRTTRITLWSAPAAAVLISILPRSTLAANKETEMILAELRQIQAQISQLQRSQGELERLLTELTSKAGEDDSFLRRSLANTETNIADVKDSLSILSARLDETNGRIGNLRREVASIRQTQQPPILVSEPTEVEPTQEGGEPPDASGAETPAVAALVPDPVDLYNQAYTDYAQMRYPLAISGFQDVMERYPESDLADNAQYWIGECYLAQRQFEEALTAFDNVVRNYPESNKLAEANYKKAVALEALGRRDEAIEQLELVIDYFPRTQVERNARQRLKALRNYQPQG